MKKKVKKNGKTEVDIKILKHWKNVSTKGKLDWLASALRFGKMRKF